MSRCRFVQPETVKLPLSDNDWIIVKKRLSEGESRAAVMSVIGTIKQDGSRTLDRDVLGLGEVAAYLLEWSFRDAADKPVPINSYSAKLDALKALDQDSYDEIDQALTAHKAAMDEENASKKKEALGTASVSPT
jgi:hypothetical protein